MSQEKKIRFPSEVMYLVGITLLAFAVAMITTTGFGVSMIVAPAYIVSQKFPVLTFGQAEYVVQGFLFVLFCCLMRKIKPVYFASFGTGLLYGAALDFWRLVIPHFNPSLTPVGFLPLELRLVYFVVGMLLTSFSVALFFQVYLYPQVYDFFVKGISGHFSIDRTRFKTAFDAGCLAVSCLLTWLCFGRFVGIGVGTLIMTVCNGPTIGFLSRQLEKRVAFYPLFPNVAQWFQF